MCPSQWKLGLVNPIPKSGTNDPRDPMSYRGITLISVVCKIYCDVIRKRLTEWLESNNIIHDEQNGFRKDRGCVDHLYSFSSIVQNRKLCKKPTFACFIDARKAFDRVNRDCLWFKLRSLGIHGNLYNSIKSLYVDVKCAVKINDIKTNWFDVNNGVKQGCILSPVLFNLYINDIVDEMNVLNCGIPMLNSKIDMLMYADDIVLMSESEQNLQKMLDCVLVWARKWRISLNESKTQVVHFRPKSHNKSTFSYKYGNVNIETVSGYKYLGLWFDEFLDFNVTTSNLASSASRALGVVISKFKAVGGTNFDTYSKLFDSFVSPILEYGSGVWGLDEFSSINSVFYRAGRFFLGIGKYAPNNATLADLAWDTPFVRQLQCVARLWSRLSKMDNDRIPKMVFEWSKHVANNNTCNKNWCFKTKSVFSKINCGLDLIIAEQISMRSVVSNVAKNARVLVEDRWKNSVLNDNRKAPNQRNKLRTYRTFKSSILAEDYVTTNMKRCHRRALALFRFGCAPIGIETGRYNNIPLDERVCTICGDGIEDEFHCFMSCTHYIENRSLLFNSIGEKDPTFLHMPVHDQFVYLMSCNGNCSRQIAKYANNILKSRRLFIMKVT